jgi:DNA-binding protein H-NS
MKDIHQVLRHKRAQHAQLAREIELLEGAAQKLQEVAALLADNEDEENAVLNEVDEEVGKPNTMAAAAAATSTAPNATESPKPRVPRWP